MEEKTQQKRGGYGVGNKMCKVLYLFLMILLYFCRFFQNSNSCLQFVFLFLLLSKRTLYVGGSKFEFGINYWKHKLPQDWE